MLGVRHHNAGRLSEAEGVYRKILRDDPEHPDALHLLGVIAHQVGNNDVAVELITRAIDIKPDFAEAHCNLGGALQKLEKFNEAVVCYQKALDIKPDYVDAYNNLGIALQKLGKLVQAVAAYNKAIDIKPDFADAHCNLGAALHGLGRPEEAVASYKKAIDIRPDYVDAHSNLGAALQELGRLDEAVASQNTAIDINPDYAEAHSNLGFALRQLGKLDEAIASFRRAIAISPDYADAHSNLSFALLAKGTLEEGLDEHEWRWRTGHFSSMGRHFIQPRWDGTSDLKNQTILVWGEQGPQDMTTWSSCLPHVSARAGHCVVECPPKLVDLFARSFPDVEVRPENLEPDPERDDFDFHLPMGSLFRHFIQDLTRTPEVDAFLIPDPDRVAFWKQRLRELGSGPFVGISWKSPVITAKRSPNYTAITDWAPLFADQEATFVNLQCKDYEDDLAAAKRDFGVTVHNFDDLDHFDDLDEVAALAGALDVVISVSTAVAAIAAGVGTPTWVISWRQSPWNNFLLAPRGPSVRFFQRDTMQSWDTAFASIAECLAARDF